MRRRLLAFYKRLHAAYGPQGWWPGQTPFEVCLGAILTQNTSWTNAERALAQLRSKGLVSYRALREVPPMRLAPLIRSSGYFNLKALRVSAFVGFVGREYGGRVAAMRRDTPRALRTKLLAVRGIGPETADSIVLYAAGLPLFVVDAYTRRIFARLGMISGREPYDAVQALFMSSLPGDAGLYNDYHAQIVRLAKEACRTRPLCGRCPLETLCPKTGVAKAGPASRRRSRLRSTGSGVRRSRQRAVPSRYVARNRVGGQ
jgi:endonuclease-3 related protein